MKKKKIKKIKTYLFLLHKLYFKTQITCFHFPMECCLHYQTHTPTGIRKDWV